MANKTATLAKYMECPTCGNTYPLSADFSCRSDKIECNRPLVFRCSPERDGLRRITESSSSGLSIFRVLLPIETDLRLKVEDSEPIRADGLAGKVGIRPGNLYLIKEFGTFSDSFKDKGIALALTYILECNEGLHSPNGERYNFQVLGVTSTGNLCNSGAEAARLTGLKSVALVPNSTEEILIKKTLSRGGYVLQMDCAYDGVTRVNQQIIESEKLPEIAWVNQFFRPVYCKGSASIMMRALKKFGFCAPDNVVYPVATGLSFGQIHDAIETFGRLGLLLNDAKTRMHSAQPEGCGTIAEAWKRGEPFLINPIKNPISIAQTLCVGNPGYDGYEVLRIIKETGGTATAVSDEEIKKGIELLLETEGLHAGTVAGTGIATLQKLVGEGISPEEKTVVILTDREIDDGGYVLPKGWEQRWIRNLKPNAQTVIKALEDILAGREEFT